MEFFKVYAKSIVAALIAGLGSLATALNPDEKGVSSVTAQEWLFAVIAFLVALGGVAIIPNALKR
jgi:hypothetical protein